MSRSAIVSLSPETGRHTMPELAADEASWSAAESKVTTRLTAQVQVVGEAEHVEPESLGLHHVVRQAFRVGGAEPLPIIHP